MVQMTGKFQQYKSENLDEYCRTVGKMLRFGMPYIARKMVTMSNPAIEILEEDGIWTIKQSTLFKSSEIKFKPNAEFDEYMPGGVLKSTATTENDKIVITSVHESGTKITKTYEFDTDKENNLIISMCHNESGQLAKRFFRRA